MTKHLAAKSVLSAALFALVAVVAPFSAEAASKNTCDVEGAAGIDSESLSATSSRPTLTGVASTSRTVQIVIRKEGSEKTYYKSKIVRVKKGEWSLRVPKKLKDGEYDVEVYCPKVSRGTSIATGTLEVGGEVASKPTAGAAFTVTSIPLLAGGTADEGESVPVAYLQVRNTGKSEIDMKGFWVKQNGTASADVVDSFTVVDGTGNSRVTTDVSLKNGAAFVKTDVSIAAGEFALFTIKANLADSFGSASGKNLKIDVTSAEGAAKTSGKFPIKGTTWELR